MPALRSLMQDDWPLVLPRIIDHAARWHGGRAVVTSGAGGAPAARHTYAEIRERAALCALMLRRLGVRPGDRVGTLATNSHRHLEAWYGIAGAGAVCHTLNPRLFERDLEYIINHAGDVVILADPAFLPLLAALAPRLRTVRAVVALAAEGAAAAGGAGGVPLPGGRAAPRRAVLCYEALLAAERPGLPSFAWHPCRETDAAGLCYTSGTTGDPKGVLYSHRSNFLHALAVALPDSLDLSAAATFLMIVPMFHANSWGLAFAAPMVGAGLVLPGAALDGPAVRRQLGEHAVTHTAGVPTVFLGLVEDARARAGAAGGGGDGLVLANHAPARDAALAALRLVVVGGAALPRSLLDFFAAAAPSAAVRQAWGMTEISPCGALNAPLGAPPPHALSSHAHAQTTPPLSAAAAHAASEAAVAAALKQGRPHVFMDMRLVDDSGKEVERDGVGSGELQVRGPIALRRYYRGKRDATDKDGWFATGDVATIDGQGRMQITDRAKDVIKSGGEWISSIAVENAASQHPGVAEAAVIGVPDPKWSERPLLVVVPVDSKNPPPAAELLAFLEGKVARWWIPERVEFVPELPHTATGKVSKLRLRAAFAARARL